MLRPLAVAVALTLAPALTVSLALALALALTLTLISTKALGLALASSRPLTYTDHCLRKSIQVNAPNAGGVEVASAGFAPRSVVNNLVSDGLIVSD